MRTFHLALVVVTLAVAGCASRRAESPDPPQPEPAERLDPIGTFDYSTNFEGMDVDGAITINRAGVEADGVIDTGGMTDPIPVSRVVVEGQTMRVLADTPDGTLEFRLNFDGDAFTGEWTLAGGSGEIRGRRR